MAIRTVLRLGDPRLRKRAKPVDQPDDPDIRAIIADLADTMHACNGAGLAAPQIGVDLRIVIFGIDNNPRYPDAPPVPLTVLLNPEITPLDDATEDGWEGCLSVPGMRGRVTRHTRIRYRGRDPAGTAIEREADGFHARVVQHECDHLDGVLFPDRITDPQMLGFIEELQEAGLLGDTPLPPE
ncbi:MAG: peptide deformylase [Alphaproteobacteria bacterium]